MTEPAGPQAAAIEALWWPTFWVFALVFLLVLAALGYALVRRRDGREPPAERSLERAVLWAVVATVVVLFAYLLGDLFAARALAGLRTEDPLVIRVTGHQWWWEVEYQDPSPARRVLTANEIRIPVGRPVQVRTRSADVIHSLWVPALHGKRDLVPGYTTAVWLQADRPGTYGGRCAEFCGHQHAKMGITLVAETPARFEAWYAAQLRPAEPPSDPLREAGLRVFLSRGCVLCHGIRGTPAGARTGPDLTHLAARRTLGAGTLPNGREQLAAWILDPQRFKPGVHMPAYPLSADELEALVAYLGGLR